MRKAFTADHLLTALSLAVLLMIVANMRTADPRLKVNYDCALFYGSSGPDAERDCRVNMMQSRLLPPTGGR